VGRILNRGDTFLLAELDKHGQDSMREAFGDRWLGFERRVIKDWLREMGLKIAKETSFELNRRLTLVIYRSMKI
jgi:ArsR family transcriptional regulator